jgi:hypothetical protein
MMVEGSSRSLPFAAAKAPRVHRVDFFQMMKLMWERGVGLMTGLAKRHIHSLF